MSTLDTNTGTYHVLSQYGYEDYIRVERIRKRKLAHEFKTALLQRVL